MGASPHSKLSWSPQWTSSPRQRLHLWWTVKVTGASLVPPLKLYLPHRLARSPTEWEPSWHRRDWNRAPSAWDSEATMRISPNKPARIDTEGPRCPLAIDAWNYSKETARWPKLEEMPSPPGPEQKSMNHYTVQESCHVSHSSASSLF